MTTTFESSTSVAAPGAGTSEHFDVLVIGAGISGIGAAYHLTATDSDQKVAVLEARSSFGGTWDLHRYPGARSDSDMYTFGYSFEPWERDDLATGDEIRRYLGGVVDKYDLGRLIRYNRKVLSAEWSSHRNCWTLQVLETDSGQVAELSANFVWMCQGYYCHDRGYTPTWPGMSDFAGEIIHPMEWNDLIDYQGKKVVVIGSGATAATIVPALAAGGAGHVTMLQRSPTYFAATPRGNEIAEKLRSVETPAEWTHEIIRRLMLLEGKALEVERRRDPDGASRAAIDLVRAQLPEGFDVDKHFTPSYPLWTQRACRVPDGDLFQAIRSGTVSMVTDEIDSFTSQGICTRSGELIDADIVVSATGFNLSIMGDIPFSVDGEPVHWSDTVTYHGMMFTGVPNLAHVYGYLRASWTLRVDLVSQVVCRLLEAMTERGATKVTPVLRPEDLDMPLRPWNDPAEFNPGYLVRSIQKVPRQGDRLPWRGTDLGYDEEVQVLPRIDFSDNALRFE